MTSRPRQQPPRSPAQPGRRAWLHRSGALAAALGSGGLANLLMGSQQLAHAADYKALVCVFLYGGNDGMNMVVPTDGGRYTRYSDVRAALALPKDKLLPLSGVNYGLHPALSGLAPLWRRGQLVPVFNVGPLFQPMTKREFRNAQEGSPLIPDSLYSHSDQQQLWECAGTSSLERTGWGGRGSDVLGTVNPVIATGSGGRFGVEELRSPLVVPGPGASFGAQGLTAKSVGWPPNALRKAAIDAMYAEPAPTDLHGAYVAMQSVAFEISDRLGELIQSRPGDELANPAIDSAFSSLIVNGRLTTAVAGQLYQVAKLIANNAQVQGNRQIFFVTHGGYDTHHDQIAGSADAGFHAGLLKELGDGLAAFQQALVNLALQRVVTTFTQSDFGRTFAPNLSNGTDHAWGNHQLVMGGAVLGRQTYGIYPELRLGGPDDVGEDDWELQGRWIPTSSVEQYAATFLKWFGARDGQLDSILPNLVNFGDQRTLGFL